MCKRLFLLTSLILLLAGAPSVFGSPVGVFNYSDDVGAVGGIGGTRYVDNDDYLILGGGSDIWGTADQFHFAYNKVSGNVRFEMTPMWDVANNYWAKIETMLRVDTSTGSVAYATATRRQDQNTTGAAPVPVGPWVGLQARSVANAGMWGGTEWSGSTPSKIAIQRVVSNGYQLVQALVDYGAGAGWQNLDTRLVPSLPDQVLLGAAVTSHDNAWLAQARVSNVAYTQDPGLVGIPTSGDPLPEACGDIPGFRIETIKAGEWSNLDAGYAAAYELVTTHAIGGDPGREYGSRIDPVVNLRDTGNGNFGDDRSYPGIDPFEYPAADPAAGDDDDQFATLITACVQLTQGIHIIGANSDDGTIIEIGGVQIGASETWKGNSDRDFVFIAPANGIYSFRALTLEGGGGASIEISEVLANGTRVLLGDVANGASAVYVPEPATIALLGFGGLAMLRVRRKR